jgi:3-dehydroquinate synthetase
MVAEARISEALGMIDVSEVALLVNGISQTGLPVSLPSFPSEIILKLMLGDKKSEEGTIQWTLLEAIGKAVWDINVPDNIVEQSLLSLLN